MSDKAIHFEPFTHESTTAFSADLGARLPGLCLHFHTAGKLNAQRDNVIWICHALTANSNPQEWWPGMFGKNKLFDPQQYFIICVNILGSCYGTTGPASLQPDGKAYAYDFPVVTIRDIVAGLEVVRQALDIKGIELLIGGSMGGQQAMEWAIQQPNLVCHLALLATNAKHSPWGIAYNESQRWAIEMDPSWGEDKAEAGRRGMELARSIALLSYRSYVAYGKTQDDHFDVPLSQRRAASYQRYQGKKLGDRFHPLSYYRLSQAMDSHDVGRSRGGIEAALSRIQANTIVMALESDELFPESEQQVLANLIPGATFVRIRSAYGHDGFLLETDQINHELSQFLIT